MKRFILYIWQLPQNIVGLLVILFTKAKKTYREFEYVSKNHSPFGVSLGNYIIFGSGLYKGNMYITNTETSYKHECGHHKQSLYLGWLYLLIVGLPSLCGNIYDRIKHKNWSSEDRNKWYYSRFPENWADELGNVHRL